MAGYSGKPLAVKLGLRENQSRHFVNVPANLRKTLGAPSGKPPARGAYDFIHIFVRTETELAEQFESLKSRLAEAGMLWVSWPKLSSPLATGLREGTVRAVGLASGLVDVKVAAIDEDWSGLKFVRRLKDRR